MKTLRLQIVLVQWDKGGFFRKNAMIMKKINLIGKILFLIQFYVLCAKFQKDWMKKKGNPPHHPSYSTDA